MRRALVLFVLAVAPSAAGAQSSQFGVRGLGLPGRGLAVRTTGTGGAFGLFDPESSQNPAALASAVNFSSAFTITQEFRRVENPAGTASVRDTRFPQFMVVGPVQRFPVAVGFSFSNYTNRDFTLATSETIAPRGVPVNVSDTLSSQGGLNDFRIAGAYRIGPRWAVGGGFHILSGSNRLVSKRVFDDSTYLSSRQTSELSFAGVGVSLGVTGQLGPNLAVSAVARSDGHVNMDRDSTRVSTIDLPYTFGLGLRWRPAQTLNVAGQTLVRTWSAANSDLLALGGAGSQNTVEAAVGAEYTSDPKRPYRRPLRLGVRYATLPFSLLPGQQPREFGVSVGSGVRFAQQRAGVDLALEHVWRSESVYSEKGFILSLGISVKP